jgi:hypothetical protein
MATFWLALGEKGLDLAHAHAAPVHGDGARAWELEATHRGRMVVPPEAVGGR